MEEQEKTEEIFETNESGWKGFKFNLDPDIFVKKKVVKQQIDICLSRAYEMSEYSRIILEGIAANKICKTSNLIFLTNRMLDLGMYYIDLGNELNKCLVDNPEIVVALKLKDDEYNELIFKSYPLVDALKGVNT